MYNTLECYSEQGFAVLLHWMVYWKLFWHRLRDTVSGMSSKMAEVHCNMVWKCVLGGGTFLWNSICFLDRSIESY